MPEDWGLYSKSRQFYVRVASWTGAPEGMALYRQQIAHMENDLRSHQRRSRLAAQVRSSVGRPSIHLPRAREGGAALQPAIIREEDPGPVAGPQEEGIAIIHEASVGPVANDHEEEDGTEPEEPEANGAAGDNSGQRDGAEAEEEADWDSQYELEELNNEPQTARTSNVRGTGGQEGIIETSSVCIRMHFLKSRQV